MRGRRAQGRSPWIGDSPARVLLQVRWIGAAVGNTIPMATTRSRRRWAVRLSITRRGGWHAWGPVSGDFERSLAAQAGAAVIQPRVDGETRRGRDHVRITVAMTIAAADIAGALAEAWQAFRDASSDDPRGWDLASAAAEVRPEDASPDRQS